MCTPPICVNCTKFKEIVIPPLLVSIVRLLFGNITLSCTIWQGIALRGLFIIDKEGVIQHSTINNLAIGRSVDETMRTLQVIRGKLCMLLNIHCYRHGMSW